MRAFAVIALAASVAGTVPGGRSVAAAAPSPPHVMLIVEENRDYPSVVGSADAPYINGLANRYGLATASYAQARPSLPNYLTLLSGSTQGVTDDGTGYSFAGPTLVDQLAQRGITWRAYMESMPGPCYAGAASGEYAKKHDPFMYFTSITAHPAQCQNVVPLESLTADVDSATAPDFIWVTPDLCDDGHDCSTATADSWLAANLPPVLASDWFSHNGVVIVTWDEGTVSTGCCNGAYGGHIATIVLAGGSQQHTTTTTAVDHAGTLRTIEQLYGLPPLNDAACACSGSLEALLPAPAAATAGLTWLTVPHRR